MLTRLGLRISTVARQVGVHCRRNIAISAVVCNKVQAAPLDPIQQLFVTKIREYTEKSKKSGGKLVDISADDEKKFNEEIAKIERHYHSKGQDMTQFPTFEFKDPASLQPVGIEIDQEEIDRVKERLEREAREEAAEEIEDPNKPYWENT